MTSIEILDAIKTLGFPIVVSAYFMWRDAKKMDKILNLLILIAGKDALKVEE